MTDPFSALRNMRGQIAELRAERDALLRAIVARNAEGSGNGVLFIPDTLIYDDSRFAMEMIAKETGMVVVCGPAEAIEQIEERP